MDVIAAELPFLTRLVSASDKKRLKLLKTANSEKISAVIECVKLCVERKEPETIDIKAKLRWRRAVLILKRNREVLKPTLVTIICILVKQAIDFASDFT